MGRHGAEKADDAEHPAAHHEQAEEEEYFHCDMETRAGQRVKREWELGSRFLTRLHEVRDAMDTHAEDAMVNGYESLIDSLTLPDLDDRHVLAAANTGGANFIVTRNPRDFPAATLGTFNIEARHPDEFVRRLLDLAPSAVVDAVREQQARLRKPPVSMADLLSLFERLGLIETVAELRREMG